jgi:hypothetical protein
MMAMAIELKSDFCAQSVSDGEQGVRKETRFCRGVQQDELR